VNTRESLVNTWLRGTAVRVVSLLFDGLGDRKVAAETALRPFCGRFAGSKAEHSQSKRLAFKRLADG
jgi:hypothetical protein